MIKQQRLDLKKSKANKLSDYGKPKKRKVIKLQKVEDACFNHFDSDKNNSAEGKVHECIQEYKTQI